MEELSEKGSGERSEQRFFIYGHQMVDHKPQSGE